MFTFLKLTGLALLLFAGTACTHSETTTEHTITADGDTLATTTTTSTTATGLDTGTVEKTGNRLQEVGAEIKHDIKQGAQEVKEEYKETRDKLKEEARDKDTIIIN